MKINELKRIIREFNGDTMHELIYELRSKKMEQTNQDPLSGADTASVRIPIADFHSPRGVDCFCGRTSKGYDSSKSFVDTSLTLTDPNSGSKYAVAVGAVIDDQTNASDKDLPVILAVGINYGQGSTHLSGVPLVAATRMRARLQQVFGHLAANNCQAASGSLKNFHLTAANFFPWITSNSWSGFAFNCIEEATLIHCCGYAGPLKYIIELITRIQPHAVVFHGANNAVPYLGGCLIREYLQTKGTVEFEVIFSDNLAPGISPAISNAIKLCGCRSASCKRSDLPFTDFDS